MMKFLKNIWNSKIFDYIFFYIVIIPFFLITLITYCFIVYIFPLLLAIIIGCGIAYQASKEFLFGSFAALAFFAVKDLGKDFAEFSGIKKDFNFVKDLVIDFKNALFYK